MKNKIFLKQVIRLHFICLLLVVFFSSLIFLYSNLDLFIASYFYNFKTASWRFDQNFLINFIYTYGPFPQLLTLNLLWFALLVAHFKKTPSNYNKHLILISAIFVSELFVTLCKEFFRRPRPDDIVFFGGDYLFAKLWQIGAQGLSFPSSHAKSGFIMIVFFYIFYFAYKKIAYFFLVFALLLGVGLSYARIAQGGHFLSDVIFSLFFAHFSVLVSVYFFANRKICFTSFVNKILFIIFSLLLFLIDWSLFFRFYTQ